MMLNSSALIFFVLFLATLSLFIWYFFHTRKVYKEMEVLENKLNLANQKLEEVDQEKKDFIDIIMHELNTPLAITSGYLSMILDIAKKEMKPKVVELLEKSYDSTRRMSKITSDLMSSSEIINQSRVQAFQAEEVIRSVVVNFEKQAKEKNIYINIKPPKVIPLPLVMADPLSVKMIMTNLIDNAIKFTKKGGITIETEQDGQELVISVVDTGSGIPKNAQSRIFEKFYQVDSSHTREAGGTGVGLFNVKNYVKEQNGKIWFESEEGRGSSFHFTLPLS